MNRIEKALAGKQVTANTKVKLFNNLHNAWLKYLKAPFNTNIEDKKEKELFKNLKETYTTYLKYISEKGDLVMK